MVAPLSGDFSPHNASNPGLDLCLAPGIARHVVQFVARHEYRHNFSLVRTDNDIELPGVHSDLGGGYLPLATEKVLLSRPQSSQVPVDMPETSTVAYDRARQLMGVMLPDLEPYLQRWSIDTWAVVLPYNKRRDMFAEKRVYAALRSERQVHGQLSLIYLRAMRELGIRNGVPFKDVPETPAFALPADLHSIAIKLQ
ncbi:PAAR domain-containing protein, partial [Pseudomonas helleri]